MVVRRTLWLLALVIGVTALAACGSPKGPAGPRPVTAAEANRLAIMRFVGYEAGGQHFDTVIPTGKGSVTLDGDVDYRRQVGYAEVSMEGSSFTLQWNAVTLLAWPAVEPASLPPASLPTALPSQVALTPTSSDIDAALALVLQFGQDRPDNAQLITTDGARWLRTATVGTTPVDVIEGPQATGSVTAAPTASAAPPMSGVDYWVDARGHLLRVDAAFGGTSTAITLTGKYVAFTVAQQLKQS